MIEQNTHYKVWELSESEAKIADLLGVETISKLQTSLTLVTEEIRGLVFGGTRDERDSQMLLLARLQGRSDLLLELLDAAVAAHSGD